MHKEHLLKIHRRPDRSVNLVLPMTSYSGGWLMKTQLRAAQLMNCGVLIRIKPTGHLDVDNVRWLEDWLESFTGQHAHHVRGKVPGEKGVLRAEQQDVELRLLGALSP